MAFPPSTRKRSFTDYQRETRGASKKEYDAFINHRGPDVKQTLGFALYESLEEKGFCTFLDDMELQLGDSIPSSIERAISSSAVQIYIFSPRYAESSWCLNELLLMLKTKGRYFIPIFCDVEPSDLRFPDKGVYKDAFAELERKRKFSKKRGREHEEKPRFSKKRLRQWKKALNESSFISGPHRFSTTTDNVETLCATIALAVQQKVGKRQMDIEAAPASTSIQVKKSNLLPTYSHPVGIEAKVKVIEGLLDDRQVKVIAVVGMGGSGKTFLLQNVYKAVKSKYAHSIWLSISQAYSLKTLQLDVAVQIGINIPEHASEETAAERIHHHLEEKSCLIVLDNLWRLPTEDSLLDKLGLQDCKVVVTTRDRRVIAYDRIYEMENLSDRDSWILFRYHAFPQGSRGREKMEEEGRKIVKNCGNLPLAIQTVAASLANCKDIRTWRLKRRRLKRAVTPIGDPDLIMQNLKLSYDFLPAELKACFAYLSFFPENEEIDADYLINLWIGEGFIPAGKYQWEIGWDLLDQLAQLCLLQIFEEPDILYGLKKYCKIHNLLYNLAIQVSKEDKCVFSVEEVFPNTSGAKGSCRILLAKKGLHNLAISDINAGYRRTLSLSQNWKITWIPENLFTNMRGLRVLDLSSTKIFTLPVSLGKMILLKHLNLRKTNIGEVPDCVKQMKSLLFLALPKFCTLPEWINELGRLQLLEWISNNTDPMPKRISKLTSLRTLRSSFLHLAIEEDKFMSINDLANMAHLEELSFIVNHEMELERLEEGILARLVKMRHLKIENNVFSKEHPQFPQTMRAMENLEMLTLEGFVVPSWICTFEYMRELRLYRFEFSDCPELQRLPNLTRLVLEGNEKCKELPNAFGTSGGFSQLRILHIESFSSLIGFPELEEGAMPCLQEFKLSECPNVKRVEGLQRLKKLELFMSYDESGGINEWRETLKEGGKYWKRIKAINSRVIIRIGD